MSYSNVAEDAVAFTFSGDRITYWYTKGPGRGKAAILIDGEIPLELRQDPNYQNRGYLDLYAPSVQYQSSTTFSGLDNGIHTIHISVSGQKNPVSSDYKVDLDC
jgi:hypothetical protein